MMQKKLMEIYNKNRNNFVGFEDAILKEIIIIPYL
jgi:hypothetical protein